jgi:putative ATP-binding cassette transporter
MNIRNSDNTIIRFYKLAKPFFVSEHYLKIIGILVLLVGLVLSIKGFDVLLSYIGRDFITALSKRREQEFIQSIVYYALAFGLGIPLVVFSRYTEERFALMWRRWLSHHTLDLYFSNNAYYKLNLAKTIDNPDQRIEEDIRSFTGTTLSLFLIFLQSIFALVAFIGVLSHISWMLTAAAVAYALLGSLFTYLLGKPLIHLNFDQLKLDADYRYKLIKVRDSAEAIAFYKGHASEKTRARQKLKSALNNILSIIKRNRTLNFFTTGYNYFLIILPTIIVAPLYFQEQIEFGVVTQAGVAFGHVINALSVIVTNFGSLSSFAAVVKRLGTFTEALEEIKNSSSENTPNYTANNSNELIVKDLTVLTPTKSRALIENISFNLESGGLLITGSSGVGKTSLIRAIVGLWPIESGTITGPNQKEIMILPQRPYLPLGTLRSQLLYGHHRHGLTDKHLYQALVQAELEGLFERVGGFEAEVDWSATLSTGEQQRIGVARALVARPKFLILDEATTAIEDSGEDNLYETIKSFTTWYISIGYRSGLKQHHSSIIELMNKGKWRLIK